MKHHDFDKEFFRKTWPGGFMTSAKALEATGMNLLDIYAKCIYPYTYQGRTALEIGPGGGFWTKILLSRFRKCWLVDVVPKTPRFVAACQNIEGYNDATWIELSSKQYNLSGVPENRIDYVWCFGVFCHLSYDARKEYLRSLYSKVMLGCDCFVMFANWNRHPSYHKIKDKQRFLNISGLNWFYDNTALAVETVQDCGFIVENADVFPNARDTLMHFSKR